MLYVFPVGDYVVFRDAGNVFNYQVHFSELSLARTPSGEIGFIHRRDSNENYPIQAENWDTIVDETGTPYSTIDEDDFLVQFNAVLPTSGGGGGGSVTVTNPVSDVEEVIFYDTDVSDVIRETTVFNPVTNTPTRTYAALDGTPYTPTFGANIETDAYLLHELLNRVSRLLLGFGPEGSVTVLQTSRTAGSYTATTGTADQCRKIRLIALTGTFSVGGITYPLATANGIIDDFSVVAPPSKKLADIAYTVDAASTVLEIIEF